MPLASRAPRILFEFSFCQLEDNWGTLVLCCIIWHQLVNSQPFMNRWMTNESSTSFIKRELMVSGAWLMAQAHERAPTLVPLLALRHEPLTIDTRSISRFQISEFALGSVSWFGEGPQSTKSPNEHFAFCKAAPTHICFVRSVGLEKKHLHLLEPSPLVIRNPRNTKN